MGQVEPYKEGGEQIKTILYFGDVHSLPGHHNTRATMLSRLIQDIKPDILVNGGDNADMPSLCSYEKGRAEFVGRTYQADINVHLDFQEKLWTPIKKQKKKMPRRVFLIGNHEERIARALQVQPELIGTIGYKDLRLEDYYDDVIGYHGNTPGVIELNGVHFAHYFVAGVSGKPSTGNSPASLALSKSLRSIVQGHSHVLDYSTKPTLGGGRIHSLVGGCFIDQSLDWAGQANDIWWRGCFVLKNVDEGNYDLETVSMERLYDEYRN